MRVSLETYAEQTGAGPLIDTAPYDPNDPQRIGDLCRRLEAEAVETVEDAGFDVQVLSIDDELESSVRVGVKVTGRDQQRFR